MFVVEAPKGQCQKVEPDRSSRLVGINPSSGGIVDWIYSHAASSASATSASLPTDNVPSCCHSASACSRHERTSQFHPYRFQQIPVTHPGSVPCAAQSCMSSSGSQQLNSCSVHLHSMGTPDERTASPSNPPRVRTRLQTLCLTSLKEGRTPRRNRFPAA